MFLILYALDLYLITGGSCFDALVRPLVAEASATFTVKGIPEFSKWVTYRDTGCAFVQQDRFVCLRPLQPAAQVGEMISCTPRTGEVSRMRIPQPNGFLSKDPTGSCFEDLGIWSNRRGDLLLRWELGGNGNHALARFDSKEKKFITQRCDRYLYLEKNSRAIANPDGDWYFIDWNGAIVVNYVDEKLGLQTLGSHDGLGSHKFGVLDACFVSRDRLHFVYGEVDGQNHARIWAVDFDTTGRKWSSRRLLGDHERIVCSVAPSVVMLDDHSLHYFWSIERLKDETPDSGLYYLAPGAHNTLRLSCSARYKAISLGESIVVCYTLFDDPAKVYFRVIRSGVPGPETSIKLRNREYNYPAWREDMILAPAGVNKLWFVDATGINTFYELSVGPWNASQQK